MAGNSYHVAYSCDRTMVRMEDKVPPFFNTNCFHKIASMPPSLKRRIQLGNPCHSLYNRSKSSSPAIMRLDEEAFTSYNSYVMLRKCAPI